MIKTTVFLLVLMLRVADFALAQDKDMAKEAMTEEETGYSLLPMPKDKEAFLQNRGYMYRGKIAAFMRPPSVANIKYSREEYCPDGKDKRSLRIKYKKAKDGFCGAYVMLLADGSDYKSISFMVRGKEGGENFELGLQDIIWHQREDSIYVGSIYRYLPNGLMKNWQKVVIPLDDFFGIDKSNLVCLAFLFEENQKGVVFIDEIKFSKNAFLNREEKIEKEGFLLLDDFNHSDLNNLGLRTHTYKKLPSYCKKERTADVFYGEAGKSLRLQCHREYSGWCGYYSLLNFAESEFYDLSKFKSLSFMVKGEEGQEIFSVGLADENYQIVGDSVKIDDISQYLPEAEVTTEWQKVTVPLSCFEELDLTHMASFIIHFPEVEDCIINIDDVKFNIGEYKGVIRP